ncbi:MAG: hypothetical protein JWR80_5555 [Bradyrhizobium sp.]|nr:hypothetical protein [Bradyrhizobium sp.]
MLRTLRLPAIAAAAFVLSAVCAQATMPSLTTTPSPATSATCAKWSRQQDSEAVEMWGVRREGGAASRELGLERLRLACMGDDRPAIVGFGSSAGFDDDYCTKNADAGICRDRVAAAAAKDAPAATGFVFFADRATNALKPAETVRLGEKLRLPDLKRRFAAYKVTSNDGEDCVTCATVVGPAGAIEVVYDAKGVGAVASYDKRVTDALGNKIDGSLAGAVGDTATCDAGMESTCESPKLRGLSYIVSDDAKCTLEIGDGAKPVKIPACAKIGGFRIFRPN